MPFIEWSHKDSPWIIPCLDIRGEKASTTASCPDGNTSDDPVEILDSYREDGADKIFIDIQDDWNARNIILPLVRRLVQGGGSLLVSVSNGQAPMDEDVDAILEAGAAAVALSTATIEHPERLSRAVSRHGSSRVLAVLNSRRSNGQWHIYTHGGTQPTGMDALEWTRRVCAEGAGAILANSLEREGDTTRGYDHVFTQAVADAASVPVIASAGCGSPEDMLRVRSQTGAAYALANTIFHRGLCSVRSAITACAVVK